jgi:hypothetical protein
VQAARGGEMSHRDPPMPACGKLQSVREGRAPSSVDRIAPERQHLQRDRHSTYADAQRLLGTPGSMIAVAPALGARGWAPIKCCSSVESMSVRPSRRWRCPAHGARAVRIQIGARARYCSASCSGVNRPVRAML